MKIRHKKNWVKKSIWLATGMLPCLFVFAACGGDTMVAEDDNTQEVRPMDQDSILVQMRQPGLSKGLSIIDSLKRDSVAAAVKSQLRENIEKTLKDYRTRFNADYFNGYFVTDLDKDGFPEVWIKTGHTRQNSRIQLFYPTLEGKWTVSTIEAEPGEYYLGDGYVIQIVTDGPGVIAENRLTINSRGELDVENIMEVDRFETPDKEIPKPAEKQIKDTPLSSTAPLKSFQ